MQDQRPTLFRRKQESVLPEPSSDLYHYVLYFDYRCKNGGGWGQERITVSKPIANPVEAREILIKCASIIRCKRQEPKIREPWPRVTKIIPTDKDFWPLNKEDIQK